VDPRLLEQQTQRLKEAGIVPGILKTDSTVEVLQTIKGSDLKVGQHLTVNQLGGIDEHGNPVLAEDEGMLLQQGEQDIMFLNRAPKSGKFFTTGAGQGRFVVTDKDTVRAILPQSPVGAAVNGQSVDAFIAAIKAADRAQDATQTPTGGPTPVP
jgi:hypothetical protein